MIYLKDAHGIRIGTYEDEWGALLAMQDLLRDREPGKPLFSVEQDGKVTHYGVLIGEIHGYLEDPREDREPDQPREGE